MNKEIETMLVDYLPLMEAVIESPEERRLKRDLAKTNYLNIHQKRRKR